jgi:hypothetical protein
MNCLACSKAVKYLLVQPVTVSCLLQYLEVDNGEAQKTVNHKMISTLCIEKSTQLAFSLFLSLSHTHTHTHTYTHMHTHSLTKRERDTSLERFFVSVVVEEEMNKKKIHIPHVRLFIIYHQLGLGCSCCCCCFTG